MYYILCILYIMYIVYYVYYILYILYIMYNIRYIYMKNEHAYDDFYTAFLPYQGVYSIVVFTHLDRDRKRCDSLAG